MKNSSAWEGFGWPKKKNLKSSTERFRSSASVVNQKRRINTILAQKARKADYLKTSEASYHVETMDGSPNHPLYVCAV